MVSSKKSAEKYISRFFNEEEYLRRIKLMREIVSGANQTDFCKRLGVPYKRWANYERGYPVPRQVAWLLYDELGVSVEWLWYGITGNLKADFLKRLEAAKIAEKEHRAAEKQYAAARERLEKATQARRRAVRKRSKGSDGEATTS